MTVSNDTAAVCLQASNACKPWPRHPDVAELADAFMASYAGRDTAINTRLARWFEHLGDRRAFSISDADVDELMGVLASSEGRTWKGRDADGRPIFKSRGVRSGATCNRYSTCLGSLYKWAKRRRLAPRGFISPTRGIERHPDAANRVRYLSDEERDRLFKVCRISTWPCCTRWSWRRSLPVRARASCCRSGGRDIDFARGFAYVGTSKNGEPRVLPLTANLLAELARHRRAAPERLVFESPKHPGRPRQFEAAWRRAVDDARIENFRFHDCRHTAASYLAQSGASLLEIADVLGHRQLAVVKRYAHLSVNSKAALVQRVLGKHSMKQKTWGWNPDPDSGWSPDASVALYRSARRAYLRRIEGFIESFRRDSFRADVIEHDSGWIELVVTWEKDGSSASLYTADRPAARELAELVRHYAELAIYREPAPATL